MGKLQLTAPYEAEVGSLELAPAIKDLWLYDLSMEGAFPFEAPQSLCVASARAPSHILRISWLLRPAGGPSPVSEVAASNGLPNANPGSDMEAERRFSFRSASVQVLQTIFHLRVVLRDLELNCRNGMKVSAASGSFDWKDRKLILSRAELLRDQTPRFFSDAIIDLKTGIFSCRTSSFSCRLQ
ncbi:MAG: hypothetical protein HQL31_03060 [Planctomycetes bacterium]|nr:hypothetical protein [Planctomycetota bacterium]